MDLWSRAKQIIPQGNQLLSKRSEIYPAYYSVANGVNVWDLQGNKYIDMSIMGVGTCILGYADAYVNLKVIQGISQGSMSTLNCPEEVELAELLLELHKWAGMVRFARTGGEAMAIAVRIARAYTNKDKIAFCGYHGWHDWYLAANLEDKTNLDIHLLPDLECAGVPKCLKGSVIPFEFNNLEQLEEIVEKHNDIGAIIIEPMRHEWPSFYILARIRDIAYRIGAVLIFDEITIGWRLHLGGSHLLFGVNPDIAVFGKAMSNGYPMSAIIGKKYIMEAVNKTFISSTYWTERIGSIAALETIKRMKEINLPRYLEDLGMDLKIGLEDLGFEVKPPNAFLKIEMNDLDSFKKRMLKKGYLAGNQIYLSYAHTQEIIDNYLEVVKNL